MKKILILILTLCMVLMLCGCTVEQDSVAGVAIEQGVLVLARLMESVILVVGTWVLGKMAKQKQLQNVTEATGKLFEVTRQTVGELQQVFVNEWKEANGGKLTDEQIRILKKELLRLVKEKLDDATMDLITAAGSDLDALITGEAESYLRRLKD